MNKYVKRSIAVLAAFATALSAALGSAWAVEPNPIISRNKPVYSQTGQPQQANDEHYFSFWNGTAPDYIAYDLSDVPDEQKKQVIAVWYNTSAFDNIGMYVNRNMEPSDYTVEVNAAAGLVYPETGWEVVETVEGNTLSSRQHLVNMEGYNWIRLNITKSDDSEGKPVSINFDVHNVSDGVSDSWLFLGDSITTGGMNNCYGTGFATHINQLDERYFPIQENGGIGGIKSIDGRENIERWLSVSQARFVSIAYGTNDCWGNPDAADEYYENTKFMIDAILAAGKIPVLPKIPASTNADVQPNVPIYNAMVDKLYEDYADKLLKGPDFEQFFTENPEYLSGDGVHPSSEGYAEMRRIWAETMYEQVYKSGEVTVPTEPEIRYGDANTDGSVTVADAAAILQYLGNSETFPLSDEGKKNADCFDTGDGITPKDALAIQKHCANITPLF